MELEEAKEILEDICKIQTQAYRNVNGKLEIVKPTYVKAIETVLQALEELQQKEKSRIIGNINEIKIEDLEPILKPHYISKEKVEKGIDRIEDYFDRLNGPDEDIDFIREVKQELLEE